MYNPIDFYLACEKIHECENISSKSNKTKEDLCYLLFFTRKHLLRGYILGVMTHTTALDLLWFHAFVCVSTLRIYPRSGCFLVKTNKSHKALDIKNFISLPPSPSRVRTWSDELALKNENDLILIGETTKQQQKDRHLKTNSNLPVCCASVRKHTEQHQASYSSPLPKRTHKDLYCHYYTTTASKSSSEHKGSVRFSNRRVLSS